MDNLREINDDDHEVTLTLALSLSPPPPPPPPSLPPQSGQRRGRANKKKNKNKNKSKSEAVVDPPYPWATATRAKVHTLDHLLSRNITTITGKMTCKSCETTYDMSFDLKAKFFEVGGYIVDHMSSMRDRAPERWNRPAHVRCERCGLASSARPVVAKRKRRINWLFMLLGEFLGFLNLEQLRYFCKHNGVHRTGAKDRLSYLIYLRVCRQLDPRGPFGLT